MFLHQAKAAERNPVLALLWHRDRFFVLFWFGLIFGFALVFWLMPLFFHYAGNYLQNESDSRFFGLNQTDVFLWDRGC